MTHEQESILQNLQSHMNLTAALNALDAAIDDKETAIEGTTQEKLEAQYLEDLAGLRYLRDVLTED
jgi:hypothetical protein